MNSITACPRPLPGQASPLGRRVSSVGAARTSCWGTARDDRRDALAVQDFGVAFNPSFILGGRMKRDSPLLYVASNFDERSAAPR
jgi:hypothetical protein